MTFEIGSLVRDTELREHGLKRVDNRVDTDMLNIVLPDQLMRKRRLPRRRRARDDKLVTNWLIHRQTISERGAPPWGVFR